MHDFEPGMLPWGPPFTLGHENAGWVDAVGPGVTGLEIGQPVLVLRTVGLWSLPALSARAWRTTARTRRRVGAAGGGLGLDGGMAPKMLVPDARHLVPLGDLDPVDAAPLTDAGSDARTTRSSGRCPLLGPGSVAVVIGVGGLGHMAVQILDALTPTIDRRGRQARARPSTLALQIGALAHGVR